MQCLKCGAERNLKDLQCPECGIFYAKYNPDATEDVKAKIKEIRKNKSKSKPTNTELDFSLKERFSKPIVKRLAIVLAGSMVITLLFFPASDLYKTEQIKEQVRKALKDPESAQFKEIFIFNHGAACGYVNAKNSLGGYVGFRRFVAIPENEAKPISETLFEQINPSNKEEKWAQVEFLTTANSYCYNHFFPESEYKAMTEELTSHLND